MFRILLAVSSLLLAAAPSGAQQHVDALTVSLLQLIATPEKYDGKLVQVQGYLDMSREGDLLYLHQIDSENVLLANAIWIRRTEQMGVDKVKINLRYVKVIGIFRLGFKEQLGNPANGIPEVFKVEPWSDPANPLKHRIETIPGVSSNH
jgi:hypothetical protein